MKMQGGQLFSQPIDEPRSGQTLSRWLGCFGIVLGSLFLSTETWGESPAASKKSSEVSMNDAQALMHAVAEKERKNQGQYLRFKASITGPDGDAAPGYEGKLWMGKEGQFRLEYPGGTLVSDGATFSEYHPKNQQVILRHAGEPGNRLLPGAAPPCR
jgi:outer membrane lipoprotein-sorting protein